MLYSLMNKNKEVLKFDLDEMYLDVIDNDYLPFELKDYVKTTKPTLDGLKKTMKDIDVLKDFFVSRTLNLSRENAKIILNVASLPQSLKTEERLKIVFYCNALTMTDNFWIKEEGNNITFEEVNLRNNRLSEVSYKIAILGEYISATREEIQPDLSSGGMFPKYWSRKEDGVYLYKTDKYENNISVICEVDCCNYLEQLGVPCVHYDLEEKDNLKFAVSKCIATNDISLIHAQSIKDWCNHTHRDFLKFIKDNFLMDFANMCVCDYVFGNTDRHFENWGFLVNENNQILCFAPLYDHNQSLLCDYMKSDIDSLIYEPTGNTFIDNAKEMFKYANIDFSKIVLSDSCEKRLKKITNKYYDSGNKKISDSFSDDFGEGGY